METSINRFLHGWTVCIWLWIFFMFIFFSFSPFDYECFDVVDSYGRKKLDSRMSKICYKYYFRRSDFKYISFLNRNVIGRCSSHMLCCFQFFPIYYIWIKCFLALGYWEKMFNVKFSFIHAFQPHNTFDNSCCITLLLCTHISKWCQCCSDCLQIHSIYLFFLRLIQPAIKIINLLSIEKMLYFLLKSHEPKTLSNEHRIKWFLHSRLCGEAKIIFGLQWAAFEIFGWTTIEKYHHYNAYIYLYESIMLYMIFQKKYTSDYLQEGRV